MFTTTTKTSYRVLSRPWRGRDIGTVIEVAGALPADLEASSEPWRGGAVPHVIEANRIDGDALIREAEWFAELARQDSQPKPSPEMIDQDEVRRRYGVDPTSSVWTRLGGPQPSSRLGFAERHLDDGRVTQSWRPGWMVHEIDPWRDEVLDFARAMESKR